MCGKSAVNELKLNNDIAGLINLFEGGDEDILREVYSALDGFGSAVIPIATDLLKHAALSNRGHLMNLIARNERGNGAIFKCFIELFKERPPKSDLEFISLIKLDCVGTLQMYPEVVCRKADYVWFKEQLVFSIRLAFEKLEELLEAGDGEQIRSDYLEQYNLLREALLQIIFDESLDRIDRARAARVLENNGYRPLDHTEAIKFALLTDRFSTITAADASDAIAYLIKSLIDECSRLDLTEPYREYDRSNWKKCPDCQYYWLSMILYAIGRSGNISAIDPVVSAFRSAHSTVWQHVIEVMQEAEPMEAAPILRALTDVRPYEGDDNRRDRLELFLTAAKRLALQPLTQTEILEKAILSRKIGEFRPNYGYLSDTYGPDRWRTDKVDMQFSPDSTKLAIRFDETLTIWNVNDGRLVRTIDDGERPDHGHAFSPDGSKIAYTLGSKVRVVEVESGKIVHAMEIPSEVSDGRSMCLAWLPDQTGLLRLGQYMEVILVDFRSASCYVMSSKVRNRNENYGMLSVSADGRMAVVTLIRYDVVTERPYGSIFKIDIPHRTMSYVNSQDNIINGAVISPDGAFVLTSATPEVCLFELESGVCVQRSKKYPNWLHMFDRASRTSCVSQSEWEFLVNTSFDSQVITAVLAKLPETDMGGKHRVYQVFNSDRSMAAVLCEGHKSIFGATVYAFCLYDLKWKTVSVDEKVMIWGPIRKS